MAGHALKFSRIALLCLFLPIIYGFGPDDLWSFAQKTSLGHAQGRTSNQPSQCSQLKHFPAKRIAIIGAGSAGSSTAYFLDQYVGDCATLEIDVYERNSYIGGRTTTVNVYDDPTEAVEIGGSIFVEINQNLVNAAKKFNLLPDDNGTDTSSTSKRDDSQEDAPDLGVWDGSQFVFVEKSGDSLATTIMKMLWKYGLSPVFTTALTKSTVNKFMKMYEEPIFPWASLTDTVRAVGLDSATGATGADYLASNWASGAFTTDVVQALTRVNYAQNLGQIHGLETMVVMAIDGAMAVPGGNWQIFAEMLKESKANLYLNTTVTNICDFNGTSDGLRYNVQTSNSSGSSQKAYHEVVLAAPYQFSDIILNVDDVQPPVEIDYVSLHVTLFATPYSLSSDYFGMDPAPLQVLTTLPVGATSGAGATPFFSVSLLRTVTNPTTNEDEFLYKIFSPEAVPDSLLVDLLLPKTGTTHPNTTADDALISWKYEKVWNSYPYLHPITEFQEFVLGPGLWYTSGIESFISTMETSSLSGMNVAANIKKSWGSPYNLTDKSNDEL